MMEFGVVLPCSADKLEAVLHSLVLGLRPLGTLHMSFKLGESIRYCEDRVFLDMNEYKMSE